MVSSEVPRVFVDTNVIFSGLYSDRGAPSAILAAVVDGRITGVTVPFALRELSRNLARKRPDKRPTSQRVLVHFEILPDPPPAAVEPWLEAGFLSDSTIVAAAVDAEVAILCSADAGLLQRLEGAVVAFRSLRPAELRTLRGL